jgi:hypothetical protein
MAALIRAGRAVVLLDALDELTADEAEAVRPLVSAWAERGGKRARCVITSRIAGYTGVPLPDAAEVELQPFTPGDVTEVIRAWGLPVEAERDLMGRTGDPAVAAMARVPLLLALLCALAGAQPVGTGLPRTRGALYERVLRWFLTGAHRTADDPAAAQLSDLQVEAQLQLLGPIAFTYATRRGGWVDLMPASDLLDAIRGAGPASTELGAPAVEVLTDLSARAGILVPDRDPSEGRAARYLFLHRTFAEFLVARHLAALPAADWLSVIAEHQWFDADWQTVIPMLGGRLDFRDARRLVTHLLMSDPDPFWQSLLTGIAVAGERPDADKILTADQLGRLAQAVSTLMHHDLGRPLIADRMAGLTYLPVPMRTALLDLLHDQDWRVREEAARALAGRTGQDVTDALLDRLHDQHSRVREAATRALAERDGQDVTAALLDCMHGAVYVREEAARALAGRAGQDVTANLLDRLHDPDE